MDPLRFGRQFRALRIRLERRQSDVAEVAGLSRSLIASIDRGQLAGVTIGALVRATTALGADVDLRLRWRGEALDRLLDEDHAAIVETVVRRLRDAGWEVAVEVSYSAWGERGSIDVLGYHAQTRALLVIEVKSVVPDSQATIHGLDRKGRIAPDLANARGWPVDHVSRLLVIGDSATSRRRVGRLDATYRAAFPARGSVVRAWLANPRSAISGLMFIAYGSQGGLRRSRRGRERVRRSNRAATTARKAVGASSDAPGGPAFDKAPVAVE